MDPCFSVVMPVRNAQPFLDEAVQSILAQSRGDFEFVILDDASTDGSRERLREWALRDSRIRLLESETPLGPAASSNQVAMAARCPIVARMDADDVALPGRFRRQLEVLLAHPEAVLVGSLAASIDANGRLVRRSDRSLVVRRFATAPIAHASIMYRADSFRRIGGYRDECAYCEDADLYQRMAAEGMILMIPEPLLLYRYSGANDRLRVQQHRVEEALDRQWALAGRAGYGSPPSGASPGNRVSPMAVVAIGNLRLWAGQRPMIVGRLFWRARLRWNRQSAVALCWAVWAAISPATLRTALRAWTRWREATIGRDVDEMAVYEWRPPQSAATRIEGADPGRRMVARAALPAIPAP